ncbi:hypothetical protein GLV93_02880 [Staphylococcus agnetis]|uniref:hypothetical protein n=1 Tax=Staphylococcus agnetis TaxID=985762 RepID=UPI001430181D|nr:hypothetical protein [Staphylococcus agnetis]NJH64662.1 hypothetical protein [Staphylococcus agnetis]
MKQNENIRSEKSTVSEKQDYRNDEKNNNGQNIKNFRISNKKTVKRNGYGDAVGVY